MAGELASLMVDWSARRGWSRPRPAQGRYALTIDLGLEVDLFQVDKDLYFEGRVAEVPEDSIERAALLNRLLKLQLARSAVDDAVLCMDRDADARHDGAGEVLLLFERHGLQGLGEARFEELLGAFVARLDLWTRAAADGASAPARAPMPLEGALRTFFP
jgi:hypothetical protein